MSLHLNDSRWPLHRGDNLKGGTLSFQSEQGCSCCPEIGMVQSSKKKTHEQRVRGRVPSTGETLLTPAVVFSKSWSAVDGHQHFSLHPRTTLQVETPVQEIIEGIDQVWVDRAQLLLGLAWQWLPGF